jgi:HD-like signal output (HDOD) protein
MEANTANLNTLPSNSGIMNLDEVMDAAKNFEPLNPTIVKLSSLLIDPNVDLNEISTLISYDQALTLKLLKAANSAYVGSAMRITSVQEAISFIGRIQIHSTSSLHALLLC